MAETEKIARGAPLRKIRRRDGDRHLLFRSRRAGAHVELTLRRSPILPLDTPFGQNGIAQIGWRKMRKCSEKTARVSAASLILVPGLAAAGRRMPSASWPAIARIVRENRPFAIFEFFRAGSKLAIAPEATAQIAPVWNHEIAKSREEIAPRSEICGRIELHARRPHNSAKLRAALLAGPAARRRRDPLRGLRVAANQFVAT
jgi:hypothetical protein